MLEHTYLSEPLFVQVPFVHNIIVNIYIFPLFQHTLNRHIKTHANLPVNASTKTVSVQSGVVLFCGLINACVCICVYMKGSSETVRVSKETY